jgi:hypothetical protein
VAAGMTQGLATFDTWSDLWTASKNFFLEVLMTLVFYVV